MSDLTLDQLDQDSAIHEALAGLYGFSRADFVRKAVLGSGALLAALAAAPDAEAGKVTDTAILNYALTFEFLQSTFYTETERVGTVAAMSPRKALWARTLGAHERAHVKILQQVLGKAAVKKPFFNFRGVTEDEDGFTRTAVAMEDLTVALLLSQVPRLSNRAITAAAFSLFTVESRHAAWARRIVGVQPVARAFDEPKSLAAANRIVLSTRFIASRPPRVTAQGLPQFTG